MLGRFGTVENMGNLADDRGEAFRRALRTFGRGYEEEAVRVPVWYDDAFVHWARCMIP